MVTKGKRAHSRHYTKSPIFYTPPDEDGFLEGIMLNWSRGGIYFQTDSDIKPDVMIRIKLLESFAENILNVEEEICEGKIVWCTHTSASKNFGIGVQFERKAETVKPKLSCELCGIKDCCSEMIKTEDYIYLCKKCHGKVKKEGCGNLEKNIYENLIGNVL